MQSANPMHGPAGFAASARILAGTLIATLFFFAVSIWFVFSSTQDALAAPPLMAPLAQVVAGLAIHVLLDAAGYRASPLDPALDEHDAAARARQVWQNTMVVRFALSELVAIGSLAAAFVVSDGGFLTYVGGMVVSLVLLLVHVWPGRRPVGRIADALERDGRSSHLRETFGFDASGPVQRL